MRPDQMQDLILELRDENEALARENAQLKERDKSIEERIISIIEDLGFIRR
jgi:FtsZ-binding cell division protein ZapB